MAHTKGEWIKTEDGEANFFGICTEKNWLLRIQQNGELLLKEQEANAKLIASAPEMIDLIKEIYEDVQNQFETGEVLPETQEYFYDKCKALIKKATE